MTTATLTRNTEDTSSPTTTTPTTSGRDHAVRRLRDLHADAGQLIAGAEWTPDVEHAVHDLSIQIRRTIAEVSGTGTFVPSRPGDGTPAVVRLRELGVLHRRLTEALRGPVDLETVHRAAIRTSALLDGLAGTLA